MMRQLLVPLGVVVLAALGFMAATPEPRRPDDPFAAVLDRSAMVRAERALLNARRDSLGGLSRAISRITTRQNAEARVRALPAGLGAYHLVVDADVPEVSRDSFTAKVRREFASLPAEPRVPVRVFVVWDTLRYGYYERAVVIPARDDQPCAVMVSVGTRRGRPAIPAAVDRIVGTCGFYARFGMPGAPIHEWLAETQGLSAISDEPPHTEVHPPRMRIAGRDVARAVPIASCLAGRDDPCGEVFFSANAWWGASGPFTELDAARGVFRASPGWANSMAFTNLARLREALGDERFGELWRSPLPGPMAYENLEGRHIATFVRGELLKDFQPHRPGPLHAGLPLALGIAIGAGFGVLAIRRTPRARS
jgi:hypothetical protein